MGTNKLLADLNGTPVVAHTCRAADAAGLPMLVVTGHEAERVSAALPTGTQTIFAPDYAEGMGASLAAGIRALPDGWDAAVVMLGDMPLVPPRLLERLAKTVTAESIAVPVRAGRQGNPAAWGRRFFPELAALTDDRGGKALLRRHEDAITAVEAGTDAIFMDADTPEALAAIRKAAGAA